jgi:hypothetical protein
MPLRRVSAPFDDPDWLFELKRDGFRALAHLGQGECRLVSRNGTRYASLSPIAGFRDHLFCNGIQVSRNPSWESAARHAGGALQDVVVALGAAFLSD